MKSYPLGPPVDALSLHFHLSAAFKIRSWQRILRIFYLFIKENKKIYVYSVKEATLRHTGLELPTQAALTAIQQYGTNSLKRPLL